MPAKSSKDDVQTAALLVVEKGYTIAAAYRKTGVSKYLIRKALDDYGADGVDMRAYGQLSSERKARRDLVIEDVRNTGSYAETARRLGLSRQRVHEIFRVYGKKSS